VAGRSRPHTWGLLPAGFGISSGREGMRQIGFTLAMPSNHAPLSSAATATADHVPRPSGPRMVRGGGCSAQARVASDRRAERRPRDPFRARGSGAVCALDWRDRPARTIDACTAVRDNGSTERESLLRRQSRCGSNWWPRWGPTSSRILRRARLIRGTARASVLCGLRSTDDGGNSARSKDASYCIGSVRAYYGGPPNASRLPRLGGKSWLGQERNR
jgi:hypothetical protein